ncbi:unnamed protein product [Ostreobium quekettii]|uniref:Uncharacterized protein n=1 Tax=Ostreobium quekettii TaxID=121088 RepID=A0A8S1J6N6_9CHLO|nr:unnamed protein product [Ostreobium quekettii]
MLPLEHSLLYQRPGPVCDAKHMALANGLSQDMHSVWRCATVLFLKCTTSETQCSVTSACAFAGEQTRLLVGAGKLVVAIFSGGCVKGRWGDSDFRQRCGNSSISKQGARGWDFLETCLGCSADVLHASPF